MRACRTFPLQLFSRLLMAAVLLVGMLAAPSAMAMAGWEHHGSAHAAGLDAGSDAIRASALHHEDCCPPQPAVEACFQACAAVACAVPILPVAQLTHSASTRESAWPDSTTLLLGSGPELETPPPRRSVPTM